MNVQFADHEDGLRTVDTGKSKIKIVLDRSIGLWTIQVESGVVPVALRDRSYTTPERALVDIRNYLDGHAERSILYKVARKPKAE